MMRGLKEILIAFVIGFASLWAFSYMRHGVRITDRSTTPAEPTHITGQPDDPRLAVSWANRAIGLDGGSGGRAKGKADVIVAVIDTGADVFHPDLAAGIWTNPGETGLDENGSDKASNGVDDDGNGYVDDVHGWNFVENSAAVTDDHGHGTHIAGIIGGQDGVAPGVSLMILKYFGTREGGADNLQNTVRAIRYAVRNGARVINYSGGGILRDSREEEALRWAESRGVLVVAAAGNESSNSDFLHFYPADYELSNIVSVGATDRAGGLIGMSNYGLHTVDIAAPGRNIFSTLPEGQHGFMTGTSQATAFVSGVAALMLSTAPDLQLADLRERLLSGARREPRLTGKIAGARALDAPGAVYQALLGGSPTLAETRSSGARQPAQNAN